MSDRPIRALRAKLERGHIWGCITPQCDVVAYTVTPSGDCPGCNERGVPIELGITLRDRETVRL